MRNTHPWRYKDDSVICIVHFQIALYHHRSKLKFKHKRGELRREGKKQHPFTYSIVG